jgi:hypothetical protein
MLQNWTVIFSSDEVEIAYKQAKRKVIIAAHTFPFLDGLILHHALVQLETPHKLYAKGLFGLGPEWCEEVSNGGFVSREINKLKLLPQYCRGIFPSGGTVNWKTGFYYIARSTNATVFLFGLDYKSTQVVIDCTFDPLVCDFQHIKRESGLRLRRFSPGQLYIPLRILFGYGDECYDVQSSCV